MICSKCGLEKDKEEFPKGKKQCKSCKNNRSKERYQENKEKIQEQHKNYYRNNKEKCNALNSKNYQENKDSILAKQKERYNKEEQHLYYLANKDKKAANDKRYREKNKDKIKTRKSAYYKENREVFILNRTAYYKENKETILAQMKETYVPTGKGPTKGEKKLLEICENLLQQRYIDRYDNQVTHPDVKMKLLCPFDCAIWADGKLFFIEYHGKQHYQHVSFGGSYTEEQLEDKLLQTQWSDKNKRITCAKLGIPLLVIPYWQHKQMEECLVNFLQFNGVDFD